jgi:hypothetical protein
MGMGGVRIAAGRFRRRVERRYDAEEPGTRRITWTGAVRSETPARRAARSRLFSPNKVQTQDQERLRAHRQRKEVWRCEARVGRGGSRAPGASGPTCCTVPSSTGACFEVMYAPGSGIPMPRARVSAEDASLGLAGAAAISCMRWACWSRKCARYRRELRKNA